ncbi:MAG: endonuclease/exonuclease/phosphatase family protein, partial [Myxococcota bacterium]
GDYVGVVDGLSGRRAPHGGLLVDPAQPERWLPGFRIADYRRAPVVNVGDELATPVVGPLNFRAESFQIAFGGDIEVRRRGPVQQVPVSWAPRLERTTIMTLNGFNLDAHVEDPALVQDPDRDVDDDVLFGRFDLLAAAIVRCAKSPDIVALQEIQDNDGAEITDVVDASETYRQLIADIRTAGGPDYAWVDIPPVSHADGGQPGGNIRNGFLFNPTRVEPIEGSLRRIAAADPAYEDSRKPLAARFRVLQGGAVLEVVNVHLASKRHQRGIFSPDRPGYDPREATRIRQGELVYEALAETRAKGVDYYITGDFNDFEFSDTLRALCGAHGINLVDTLPEAERYDYNHRGQLQVLMHGIVPRQLFEAGAVDYEILHGNELIGVEPGVEFTKASDHAYVMASLEVGARRPG